MAETVVINIEANTQGLQSTIDLLTKLGVVEQKVADEFRKTNEQNVTSLNKGVQATTKEFEKLDKAVKGIKADNQLAKGLDASKEIAKTGNSFTSLRQQFKDATKEVEQLTVQFGALDARTIAAAQKAGELGSEIDNINKQIAALTPEGKFQAIQNLGGAIAGVFQVATGALQAFGVESEQATKIAQQFQGALNIFGGLSQLTQLKDSLTAVKAALGLTTAAQVANTTATEAGIVATEAEAVANTTAAGTFRALTAAIASNPFGAVLIAITAVVGAISLFSDETDEATQKVKELNSELETSQSGYDAEVRALSRIGQVQIDNLQTSIRVRKAQGAGIQEIAELERKLLEEQAKQLQIRANINTSALNEDKKAYDALLKTGGEESAAARKEIEKRIDDREEFNKQVVVDAQLLKNKLKVLEAETTAELKKEQDQRAKSEAEVTANLKKEQAERAKAREEALAANFNKALKDNEDYYAKLRNLAKANVQNEDELKDLNVVITGEELRKKLELYEKFGKDTSAILAQIAENAKTGIVVKITANVDPVKKAIDEVNEATDKLRTQPSNTFVDEKAIERLKKAQEQLLELKESVKDLAIGTGLDIVFGQIDKIFEEQLDRVNRLKESQLEAITEEEQALNESYENRKIGKRELELEQERLTRQRVAAEKKAEKEIIEIKKKQDIANRLSALFNIAINTAEAIMKTNAQLGALAAPLIPLIYAQGAIQAAAVLAQPLPKYKKGTLSVGGVGSEDTELALLQPGEAVIPTETNRRYHPAIKAIYHGKIKPEDINNFVNLKLRGDYSPADARPVTAKMDTSDLYALGRIMKKNDGVYVRNINELAAIIADSYNPRR